MTRRDPPAQTQASIWWPRIAYIVVVAVATLNNFAPDFDLNNVVDRLGRGLNPLVSNRALIDAVRNIALFGGWGAVWAVTSKKSPLPIILLATLSGVILSASVEGLQLFSSVRRTSVIDVGTNTLGALLGALTIVGAETVVRRLKFEKSYIGVPAAGFAIPYGLAILAHATVMARATDFVLQRGGALERMEAALSAISLDSLLHLPGLDFFIYLPLGVLGVATAAESGRTHREGARWTIVIATALALAAEFSRGLLGLTIWFGPIVVHAAAIATGAILTARYLPAATTRWRGAIRPLRVLQVYGAILLLWSWHPLIPDLSLASIVEQLQPSRWLPIAGDRVDLFSVGDVIVGFMLYFPLGVLLSAWPWTQRGALRGPIPALILSALAEGGQIFIQGRFFALSDFLIQSAGVLIGWAVCWRAGFPVRGELRTAVRPSRVSVATKPTSR